MDEVFEKLRAILQPYRSVLVTTVDRPGCLSLDTAAVTRSGRAQAFGSVRTTKRYVSYHLMPVYENPSLLEDVSPGLRARMQGKSCFNFTTVDHELFTELTDLTREAYRDFEARDRLSGG